ncbi:hypothetical protein D3C78_1715900 [compost metagenome]
MLKDISELSFIWPTYFSGTEKLTFKGLMLDKFAISVDGVKYPPTETERKPILPLKGA